MKSVLIFLLSFLLANCSSSNSENNNKLLSDKPIIIFETDIGNDVDDALALDMIYKYVDKKQINLLAICSNKDCEYSTEFIHIMNHWYGYPQVPIGKVINGIDSESDARNYAKYVSLMKDENNMELFKRPSFKYDSIPDAVNLYRKILAKQEDNSVTIVSVGFSTNIVRVLHSEADEFSELSGKELIKKKVKLLSIMAGSFTEPKRAEYNVFKDIPSAKAIVEEWPSQIVFTPYEAGIAVKYPATSIENDFNWTDVHPVVEAYKYYLDMPYDRPTWDLIALLYVVDKSDEYFTESEKGIISINNNGHSFFEPNVAGKHSFLTISETQAIATQSYFVSLISQKPISKY
jgi:inosine-uridine nucleoside N-ribohydrolase